MYPDWAVHLIHGSPVCNFLLTDQSNYEAYSNKNRMNLNAAWPRRRENREFGSYFFQTGKTQGIFVVTQGKFLRHRENIFDCIY